MIANAAGDLSLKASDRFGIAGVGLFVLAFGLAMLLKPRWMSTPAKWEYKNAEAIEPSELTLVLVRLFGLVWTIAGMAILVNAAFR